MTGSRRFASYSQCFVCPKIRIDRYCVCCNSYVWASHWKRALEPSALVLSPDRTFWSCYQNIHFPIKLFIDQAWMIKEIDQILTFFEKISNFWKLQVLFTVFRRFWHCQYKWSTFLSTNLLPPILKTVLQAQITF